MTTTAPPVMRLRPARRTPRWWRDAAGAVAWLSLLAVVALWVSGGGVQALGSGEGVEALGRLAGLLGSDLMLLQVLLMARIPLVERAYGQDELARRHRWVGFASVDLLLVHIVLIVPAYTTAARGILATAWDLTTTYPGMLLAVAGAVCLLMAAATSIRAARRRLRYESWHLLHLYAYLGVGLALPHQLWTGADFLRSPVATAYWWTAYLLTLAAVVIYRVGVPAHRSWRHRLVVEGVAPNGPDTVSVHVTGRDLHRLPVAAGQFLSWRFLDGPGWSRAHPYSLSAAPTTAGLRITVKNLGDGSARLQGLRPGTRVLIEGPYGRLTQDVRTRRRVTLMASGIGITPLRALLEDLDQAPGDVTLLYRASGQHDVVFRDELDALAAQRGARVVYLLGPRRRGRPSWLPVDAGDVPDEVVLRRLVPDVADHDVYVCGAPGWLDAAARAARAAGVPAENIHTERFAW